MLLFGVSASAQPTAFLEQDGVLSIEAEHFANSATSTYSSYALVHFWALEPRSGASGLQAMWSLPDERGEDGNGPTAPPGKEGARLDFQILIETTGTYYVWVRGRSIGGESNGVHVGVDNVEPQRTKYTKCIPLIQLPVRQAPAGEFCQQIVRNRHID